MDIQATLEQLRQELKRIDDAIAALEGLSQPALRRGRPPKSADTVASGGPRRRVMSAAARAKIAAAQRARWAKQKGTTPAKKTAPAQKKSGGRRTMSASVRKRLSAMMKARWAERKKAA
jgi:hypothetical protein